MNELTPVQHQTRPLVSRSSKWKKGLQYKALYIMLIPGFLYFLLFHYVPMYGVTLAFKDFSITKGILDSPWAGFKYFQEAFSDPNFLLVLRNTLIISFYKLAIGFPIPILFAVLLNEVSQQKFKKFVQTVSYLPHFISWVVLAGIFIDVFSLDGPVNFVMKLMGQTPHLFLTDEKYFRGILVITDIFKEFGWSSIVYFAAISGIDSSMYEAAVLDGASRFKQIVHITLPSLIPVIAIMLILRMANILDAGFDQIFNLYNPQVYNVSDIIDTYVYRKGLVQMEYSFSTAIGLFKSGVALILIVTVNRIVRQFGGKEYTIW